MPIGAGIRVAATFLEKDSAEVIPWHLPLAVFPITNLVDTRQQTQSSMDSLFSLDSSYIP